MTRCASKWVVRAGGETFPEVAALPPHLFVLLLKIESHCWNKAWTWVGNDKLVAELNRSLRSLQRGMEQLEDRGVIARIMSDRERPERMGIVLLKRIDTARPYCRTDRQLKELSYDIRDRWVGVTNSTGEINPVILGGKAEGPKADSGETPEKPRENGASECHERHTRSAIGGTPGMTRTSPEEESLKKSRDKQQTPPALKIAGEPELTPEASSAVESIRKAVEGSDRPEAAQGVVDVARAALVKGHGPGRVTDLAREAMKPGIVNPGGWLRRVIEARGADEGGILRDRPKPPPTPSTPTIKLDEAVAAIYDSAAKSGKVGIGVGRRRPSYAGRAN